MSQNQIANAALENLFQTAVEGVNSTKLNLLPPGPYRAQISKVTPPENLGDKGSVGFRVYFDILNKPDEEAVFAPLNATIFLDLTPQCYLDMGEGKNVGLGRLREAVGQNTPDPWTFQNLVGALCQVLVEHVPSKKEAGVVNAQVKKIVSNDTELAG